jgi:hypothetical protein
MKEEKNCNCDEAEGPHEHCANCDCVLDYYDPHPTICRSCEKLEEAA